MPLASERQEQTARCPQRCRSSCGLACCALRMERATYESSCVSCEGGGWSDASMQLAGGVPNCPFPVPDTRTRGGFQTGVMGVNKIGERKLCLRTLYRGRGGNARCPARSATLSAAPVSAQRHGSRNVVRPSAPVRTRTRERSRSYGCNRKIFFLLHRYPTALPQRKG